MSSLAVGSPRSARVVRTEAACRPLAVAPSMPYSRAAIAVTQAPQLFLPSAVEYPGSIGFPASTSAITRRVSGLASAG